MALMLILWTPSWKSVPKVVTRSALCDGTVAVSLLVGQGHGDADLAGLDIDVPNPEMPSQRSVASLGAFDATLGNYINGIPADIALKLANLVVPITEDMKDVPVAELKARGITRDFSFIEQQCGMFSYSGLELDKVRKLRADFGIYIVDSGRICVAAMNEKNIEYITDSIAKVL